MDVREILLLLAICLAAQSKAQPINVDQINSIEDSINLLKSLKVDMINALSKIVLYTRATEDEINHVLSVPMNPFDVIEEILEKGKEILAGSNVEIIQALPCIQAANEDINILSSDAYANQTVCLAESSKMLKLFALMINSLKYDQEVENQYIDRVYKYCFTNYPFDSIKIKECFVTQSDGCKSSVEKGFLPDAEATLETMKTITPQPFKNLKVCASNVGEFIYNRKIEIIDSFQKCIDDVTG